jgi:HSP20 family protein
LEEMMDEMMRHAFKASPKRQGPYGPYVYGFSMSLGRNGKPVIREFGNMRKGRSGPRIRERREPLVDVMKEEEEVVVVAELPGVEKKDVNLHTAYDELVISVDAPKRRFYKKLKLPAEVDPDSVRISYKNGVLEVRLKKIMEEKVKEPVS